MQTAKVFDPFSFSWVFVALLPLLISATNEETQLFDYLKPVCLKLLSYFLLKKQVEKLKQNGNGHYGRHGLVTERALSHRFPLGYFLSLLNCWHLHFFWVSYCLCIGISDPKGLALRWDSLVIKCSFIDCCHLVNDAERPQWWILTLCIILWMFVPLSHFMGRIEKEKKTKIAGYGFYNVHSTLDCDFWIKP